jgi:preprotein translocase subunit Sec63
MSVIQLVCPVTVTFALQRPATADMDKENAEKNAYEVVDVGSDATEADIKKAYRQRSLKTHPDRVRPLVLSLLTTYGLLSRSEPPS